MPWSKEKDAELLRLFQDGKAPYQPDATGKIAAKDISSVWDDNAILRTNYTKRLFYQIYRRKAAEFLTNKAKTGARQKKQARAASAPAPAPAASADEAEEQDDADFDPESEAQEAEEAEAAAEAETAAAEEEVEADEEPPAEAFARMTITTASTTLRVPALIYEYSDTEGQVFVTADVLMLSGACVQDTHVEIDAAGRWITVWVKIPEVFLNPARIAVEDGKRGKVSLGSKPAALGGAVNVLRESCEEVEGRPAMPFKFKLPVVCKPFFLIKPFIGTYAHDWKKQTDANNHYKILHLDLMALQAPRSTTKKLKESKTPMNVGDYEDTDSDDSVAAQDGDGDANM